MDDKVFKKDYVQGSNALLIKRLKNANGIIFVNANNKVEVHLCLESGVWSGAEILCSAL